MATKHAELIKIATATGDVSFAGIGLASLLELLPPIAAGLTIIWTLIRIWETDTVRGWTGRSKGGQ